MAKHECKYDIEIMDMKSDIKDIKKDVRSLLKFKWQIMGGAASIGILFSLAASLLGFLK